MEYNRSQITEIIKQQIKDLMKKSEWAQYVESGDLMQRTLYSLGLDNLDIYQIIFLTENKLGVYFDDADLKQDYSKLTVGNFVELAVKNYNAKQKITKQTITAKPTTKVNKVINFATIEESVRKTFSSFGIPANDSPLKFSGFDFMDALWLMNEIDREFKLPSGYTSSEFEKTYQSKRSLSGIYDLYSTVSYGDIMRILCTKFQVKKPTIPNSIIAINQEKTL